MAITINGSGSVTGLTSLPDTAMSDGSVIQVVTASTSNEGTVSNSTSAGSTNSTLVDSGLTATITPASASNKVLVLVHQQYWIDNGSDEAQTQISMVLRDGSNNNLVSAPGYDQLRFKNILAHANYFDLNYLHSPSTASAFTYKMSYCYWYISTGNGSLKSQYDNGASRASYITLMEIKA
tara:strand:+ start:158 stop:697 length:540 start_codon:yes stop_codon:yes gene_type:complete